MGKNKKKTAQMFSNFLAFKAGQGNQNPKPNVIIVNKPLLPALLQQAQTSFQTPHSDQDKLTELLDDNSPNVGSVPSHTIAMNKPSGSGTNQITNRWKPIEDSSSIQVNMRKDPNRPNLTIVEGSASKIQLVIDKSKKQSSQPSHSPKPAEEPQSNTPPLDTMPGTSTQPIQQPMNAQSTQPSDIPKQLYKGTNYESSSSSQANPQPDETPTEQTEKVKKGPSWILAPHAKAKTNHSSWQSSSVNPPFSTGWPRSMLLAAQKSQQTSCPTPVQLQASEVPEPLNVQTDVYSIPPQAYSPSDVYCETVNNDGEVTDEELESSDMLPAGTKRLSAFQRLGPVAEQPKKSKLTINLLCQKDVRNVVDESDDIPTHLRDYITTSVDETVVKYLPMWPFKKNIAPVRMVTTRVSKSVMIIETEYMEEAYTRDNRFLLVSVTGYPNDWKKEEVLDAVLESVKGKSFIPCFVEFSRIACRFLVIRSRLALLAIHKYGFIIHIGQVELIISLSTIHLNLNQLDFVPRLILRKLLSNRLDGTSLDLSEFTLKNDISHFIYFPLHSVSNQTELIHLQSTIPWECLTSLNLAHNKITSLTGLDLLQTTPKLQHLNLSHNCIEKATMLLQCRNLPLKTIHLEGNPLCNDYIEQEHYIKVLTMLFSELTEIDGVPIKNSHALPDSKRNYCPEDATHIVEKVLEVIFPLLDASQEQRYLMEDLYHEDAVLTITFMYKLRYGTVYKDYRNLFNRARVMDEGEMECIVGPSAIAKIINRWPDMLHDPSTFNIDVLYHSDTTTIVRIGGIVKITAESLADEEHLLAFTRTLVLNSSDSSKYKITNELLYWDMPERSYAETAFKVTRVKPKNLNLRLDAPPDEDLKEKLLNVFMQITELEKKPCERCLEAKDWNIRNALEYLSKLLKLDNLESIMGDP